MAPVLVLLLLLTTGAVPPTPLIDPAAVLAQRMRAEKPAFDERKARITAELAALPASPLPPAHWSRTWGGTYLTILQARGLQGRLCIGDSGATFERARSERINHGPVIDELPGGGGVIVDWVINPDDCTDAGVGRRMCFVTWGTKAMIGSEAAVLMLVNSLNEGGNGMGALPEFFQRSAPDGTHRPSAMELPTVRPILPPEWAPRLFDRRVELKATTVRLVAESDNGDLRRKVFRVGLDAGADRGAFVGMTLPFQRGTARGRLTIDKVERATCEGALDVWSHADTPLAPPQPGEVFSIPGTSLPAPPAPDAK